MVVKLKSLEQLLKEGIIVKRGSIYYYSSQNFNDVIVEDMFSYFGEVWQININNSHSFRITNDPARYNFSFAWTESLPPVAKLLYGK